MAKTDLRYPIYAKAYDDGETITYSGGKVLAKAIEAKIAINSNDVVLYADGGAAEVDNSFSDGTITVGIDDLPSFAKVDLLGYVEGAVIDAISGEKELSTAGAEASYVGFGFYGKGTKEKVPYWRAIWLIKTIFGEPADDFKTKGEKTEFQTPTVEGAIMTASWDATYWKEEGRFRTEAAAKAWLDGKAGITAKAANVASSVASGTYTGNKSVVLTTTEAGGEIKYTNDGTIPSATNGTGYSEPIALTAPENVCIKAICTAAGKANSDILELYITLT